MDDCSSEGFVGKYTRLKGASWMLLQQKPINDWLKIIHEDSTANLRESIETENNFYAEW